MNKTILIILLVALVLSATFAVTTVISAATSVSKDTSFCNCDGDRGWGPENSCPPLTSGQESYCKKYA
jgi:hypothetical protein